MSDSDARNEADDELDPSEIEPKVPAAGQVEQDHQYGEFDEQEEFVEHDEYGREPAPAELSTEQSVQDESNAGASGVSSMEPPQTQGEPIDLSVERFVESEVPPRRNRFDGPAAGIRRA
ncbi:MAG: hypothetical protein MI861_05165, partial [Pirellulales bacterium]|nr:hypothetical protein [Pirellulales bacterium]